VLQQYRFDLFVTVVGLRMSTGRPVIADAANLYAGLRPRMLAQARTHGYPTAWLSSTSPWKPASRRTGSARGRSRRTKSARSTAR